MLVDRYAGVACTIHRVRYSVVESAVLLVTVCYIFILHSLHVSKPLFFFFFFFFFFFLDLGSDRCSRDQGLPQLPDCLSSLVHVCRCGGGDSLSWRGCRENRANGIGGGDGGSCGSREDGPITAEDKYGSHRYNVKTAVKDVEGREGAWLEVWLVGLETLLTLLEMATLASLAPPPELPVPLPSPVSTAVTSSSSSSPSLLPVGVAQKVIFTHNFVKVKPP